MDQARPLSQNADIQTDHTEEFPPLADDRTYKQARTNEKTRHTKIVNRIDKHMAELGSRTELAFMRKELASQLEECIRAHNIFRNSPTQMAIPEDDWVDKLERATSDCYTRIEQYIRTSTRAPSHTSSRSASKSSDKYSSISHHTQTSLQQDNILQFLQSPSQRSSITPSMSASHTSQHSSSKATIRILAKTVEEEREARLRIQQQLDQLSAGYAQKEKDLARESLERCRTIDTIAQENKNLQQWLHTRNEQLTKEQQHRCETESHLKAELQKQQRTIDAVNQAREDDRHRYNRELEVRISDITKAFEEKLSFLQQQQNIGDSFKRCEGDQPLYFGAKPKKRVENATHNTQNANDYDLYEDDATEVSDQDQSRPPSYKKVDWNAFSSKQHTSFKKEKPMIDSASWSFFDDTHSTRQHAAAPSRSVFRVPKIDLKPFDGDPKKWQDFIAIFKDLVHSDPNLTTTQKMAVLKQCLSDDIKDGLGDSLSSPALYSQALQELEETYGHPKIVSRSYIQSLLNVPKINCNDYKSLLKVSQNINGSVSSLKSGGYQHELQSSTLLEIVLTKMPPDIQSRWGRQIIKHHPTPLDLQDFSAWLHKFVKGEMMAKHGQIQLGGSQQQPKQEGKQKERKPNGPPKVHTLGTPLHEGGEKKSQERKNDSKAKKLICLLCKEEHRLAHCKQFAAKSLEERLQFIKKSGCCLNCLSKGHMVKECSSRRRCEAKECKLRHHTLLHGASHISLPPKDQETPPPAEKKSESQPPGNEEKKVVGTHTILGDDITTLLQVVPVVVQSNNKAIETFALLDQGSEASLIIQSLANQLNLEGPSEMTQLGTFHGNDPEIQTKRVSFSILPRNRSRSFAVKNAYSVPKLNVTSRRINWPAIQHQWKHLSDLELPLVDSSKVKILLGRDVMRVHDVLDVRTPPEGMEAPDGLQTHFGWCLTGPVPTSMLYHSKPVVTFLHVSRNTVYQQLLEAVTQFWLTESFGVRCLSNPPMSSEDKKALNILKETIRHTGERYEVGLMLRDQQFNFPNNREAALRHLYSLERRFKKDPVFAESYRKVVEEYISLGHAIEASKDPVPVGREWTLPHHGVQTAAKPGKVRVVFNPSARHRGTSLNEQLYKGPDLLTGLIGVLLRFRRLPVPISGDIEKMYHQVRIPSHQQSLLRFLWRTPGSTEEPKTYQMTVHIFGAVSSPTSCIFALRRTAEDFGHLYPQVADMIINNVYVDNYLDCTETEEEAISRRQDISALLNLGGFNMVQWLSFSRSVLATVDKGDLSRSLDLDADRLPIERTLGMLWDCQTDTFIFKTSTRTDIKTKREVLQEISSIYDPMGFLVPVVMVAKVLMQDIWRSGIDWDDHLPPSLLSTWKAWASDLVSISGLKIPRCFRKLSKPTDYELHVFTDASDIGFAACVYLRAQYGQETFSLNLIMAKARVSPLRQLSIPRLELQGAVLGARLCASVKKELGEIATRIFYWCDSQTVLQWIHSKTCKYHAFVAHRVTEISDTSTAIQWRHVPGELNPADDGSRGIPALHLTSQHRWFRGPDFLLMPDSYWPAPIEIPEPSTEDPEVVPAKWVGSLRVREPHRIYTLVQESSDIISLKRKVAWLLRFSNNHALSLKQLPKVGEKWLIPAEIRDASNLIIKVDQAHHFAMELDYLRRKKPVPVTSKLASFTPTIDTVGILRVGGKLQHASIPEFAKHPVILSPESQLATMIIREIHERLGHASTERTLHELRQQFQVLQPRASIQRVIKKCFQCKRRDSMPDPPLMGPLPASRLQSHLPAFSNVGIDFFGPFSLTIFRRKVKRYGVMFTCLDCRAVHIEVAHSLDLDSFMMAFSRFVDLRGLPRICYSDNGTNLVAGEQEIQDAMAGWNRELLANKMADQDVEWRFSPPASPHFGGSWERLIKSAKTAIRGVLNERTLTDEILLTVMSGVTALLNARPLTYVSVNPLDPQPLTPNHFLTGRANPRLRVDDAEQFGGLSKKRWLDAQAIITHFWNRWLKEYIPDLIERRKWLRPRRNLAVDDVVLVIMPNTKRGNWPIGRVVRVITGQDGVVRSAEVKVIKALPGRKGRKDPADVKTRSTIFVRSVHKLCLLEADIEDVSSAGNRAGCVADN